MKLVLLVAGLLVATAAHADVTQRAKNTWSAMQVKVGIGNQWGADERVNFRKAEPKPVAFGRLEIGTWNRFGLDGEIGRRIDISNQWNARAAITFKLKGGRD